MGLSRTYLRLLIRAHKNVGFKGPVLCLGNQAVFATHDELKTLFREEGCPFRDTENIKGTVDLGEYYKGNEFVHAKTFFAMMGIDDYLDMDKFNDDKPMMLHDLNVPIPETLQNRFSLIFDGGTMEHIFDIRTTFENIVKALRVGGWVIHSSPLPSLSFFDHGFYSFSPSLFYDFYAANRFSNFTSYITQNQSKTYGPYGNSFFDQPLAPCLCVKYPFIANGAKCLDARKSTLLFFLAQKQKNVDTIQIPTQGIYDPEKKGMLLLPSSLSPTWVPSRLQPLLRPLVPLLRPLIPTLTRMYLVQVVVSHIHRRNLVEIV